MAIFETAKYFENKGVKNTIGINKGGTVDLGFVKLTMTNALHSCSIKDGDNCFTAARLRDMCSR